MLDLESLHRFLPIGQALGIGPKDCWDAPKSLHTALGSHISFCRTAHASRLCHSKAGLVLVQEDFPLPQDRPLFVVSDLDKALVQLLTLWDPWRPQVEDFYAHPSAEIHPTAVIEGHVEAHTWIGPFCYVEKGAVVGAGSRLEAHVTLRSRTRLGMRCWLQSGVVVGEDGFGFGSDPLSPGHRIPHLAGVRIGDEVHLGNNTVVAAGSWEPTRIGDESKLDALIQVGHNAQIGKKTYLAAQSGLAGSAVLGDQVLVGGAASIAQGVQVGDRAQILAKSGVTKDVPEGACWGGFPARPYREWLRGIVQK